jgi:23S rRNA-/tRNA-specific pseudouridylate synthase
LRALHDSFSRKKINANQMMSPFARRSGRRLGRITDRPTAGPRGVTPWASCAARRAVSTEHDTRLGGTVLRAGLEHPARLDRFLAEQSTALPFSFVQKLIRTRKVKIQEPDGAWARERDSARRLEPGQLVHVHSQLFAAACNAPANSSPRALGLPNRDIQRVREAVLFENAECIVINKPSGVAVQGGSKIPHVCMCECLIV